jgi:hypothetical protein
MYTLNEQTLEVLLGIKYLIKTQQLSPNEIIALIDETLNNADNDE